MPMAKEKVKTPLADGAVSLLYEIPFSFSWMIILDLYTVLSWFIVLMGTKPHAVSFTLAICTEREDIKPA